MTILQQLGIDRTSTAERLALVHEIIVHPEVTH
jgi:hypothetical protein